MEKTIETKFENLNSKSFGEKGDSEESLLPDIAMYVAEQSSSCGGCTNPDGEKVLAVLNHIKPEILSAVIGDTLIKNSDSFFNNAADYLDEGEADEILRREAEDYIEE